MNIGLFSVAFIGHGGGFEQQLVRIALKLKKRGHSVSIICLSQLATFQLARILSFLYFKPRVKIPEIKNTPQELRGSNIPVREFSSLSELKKIAEQMDIIYAKNELLDSLFLFLIKNTNTPPLICGFHTLLTYASATTLHTKLHNWFYSSFFYFSLLKIYDAFHCLNKTQKKYIQRKIKKSKIFVIPNFIEIPSRLSQRKSKSPFTILFVGRLTQEKGIDFFLSIIRKVNKMLNSLQVEFIICGSGPLENKVRQIAKEYSNVHYKGQVLPTEMGTIYKSSDVLCITSRGETFSLSAAQAQSYGVPVISFKIEGVSDIIVHERNGFLVMLNNTAEYCKRIMQLIHYKNKQKSKYLAMSNFARKFIKDNFSSRILIPQYELHFSEVVSQRTARSIKK